VKVARLSEIIRWTAKFLRSGQTHGVVPATFIVDTAEELWIADRHSEHVACAAGKEVLAAGEIVFERRDQEVWAREITNQSTGYCPEPDSWTVVTRVLKSLGLPHPSSFTVAFEFRRCDHCGSINIIKDQVFECAVCNSPLSQVWNYQ
jgi:hypothetical protein